MENIDVSFPYFIDFPQVSKLDTNIIYASIFDASSAYIKGLIKIDTANFTKSKPTILYLILMSMPVQNHKLLSYEYVWCL